jgi:hypothetical protein
MSGLQMSSAYVGSAKTDLQKSGLQMSSANVGSAKIKSENVASRSEIVKQ